jgi:predicted RNA methylase
MCKLAEIDKKDRVYDLGSGDGTAIITAASEFGATCVGIEIDPLRAYLSKTRLRMEHVEKKVTILQRNFFDVPISEATVVFVYLVPKALLKLKSKFASELKAGTRVVSYRYKIPYLPLKKQDEVHQLYLYTIPKSFVAQ